MHWNSFLSYIKNPFAAVTLNRIEKIIRIFSEKKVYYFVWNCVMQTRVNSLFPRHVWRNNKKQINVFQCQRTHTHIRWALRICTFFNYQFAFACAYRYEGHCLDWCHISTNQQIHEFDRKDFSSHKRTHWKTIEYSICRFGNFQCLFANSE